MRNLAVLLLALTLGACAPVSTKKMDAGDASVGDRLLVNLDAAWNQITLPNTGPAQSWTMEGLPVDQLLIYSGVKDGEVIHGTTAGSKLKSFAFRSSMQPDEIVAMFEGMLTRDGSTFKLVKLEPSGFAGGKGLRFEYGLIRKVDNVRLSGVGYATLNSGELFALLYSAPQLGFFARHQPQVERIAASARIGAAKKPAAPAPGYVPSQIGDPVREGRCAQGMNTMECRARGLR